MGTRDLKPDEWRVLQAAAQAHQEREKLLQRLLQKRLKWTAPKLSRTLGALEDLGFLVREAEGATKRVRITPSGHAHFRAKLQAPPTETAPEFLKDRVNNLIFQVKHAGLPADESMRRTGFMLNPAFRNSKYWHGVTFDAVHVHVTSQHVILFVQPFVADDPFKALKEGHDKALRALDAVRKLAPGLKPAVETIEAVDEETQTLVERARPVFLEIQKQEHAFVNEPIAAFFHRRGQRIEVRDANNEVRLISDVSTGKVELEAVHPVHAAEDARHVQNEFLRPLVEGKFVGLAEVPPRVHALEGQAATLEEDRAEVYRLLRAHLTFTERDKLYRTIEEQRDAMRALHADKEAMERRLRELEARVAGAATAKARAFTVEENPGYG